MAWRPRPTKLRVGRASSPSRSPHGTGEAGTASGHSAHTGLVGLACDLDGELAPRARSAMSRCSSSAVRAARSSASRCNRAPSAAAAASVLARSRASRVAARARSSSAFALRLRSASSSRARCRRSS
eukprot:1318928-Prymnesium_polylepis.1